MTIRHATEDDLDALRALWEHLAGREPDPPPWADVSWEANRAEIERALDANALFLAEENGDAVGFVTAWLEDHVARIGDLYVADAGAAHGTGRALVETVIENLARPRRHAPAPEREPPVARLLREARLPRGVPQPRPRARGCGTVGEGRSYGSIHVQTDDLGAVERAVPAVRAAPAGRLARQHASRRRDGGWITVYDDVCDRDPSMLRRLAKELSERTGAVVIALGVEHEEVVRFVLLEAGRIVDEYLSVPEYYGPLPPGDVIALAANPRVVARLTGAEPGAVRAVARTAASPAELPPAASCWRRSPPRSGSKAPTTAGRRDVITLYDAARCPYCARVRIVLAEKGVPYDPVEIDLHDRPAWLYEKNPAGKVPVLEEDGWVLPESAVISEFLNERYPEPPLWPDDPGERAAGRLLVFRFDDFSKPYYAFRRGEEGARERFDEELGFLDVLLEGRSGSPGAPSASPTSRSSRGWCVPATCSRSRSIRGRRWRMARARVGAAVRRGRARARGVAVMGASHARPDHEPAGRRELRRARRPQHARVHRRGGGAVRPAPRTDPRRPALRPPGADRLHAGGDPRAARAARGARARHLLPLGLALRARGRDPALARLPGVELPRLLARVVAGRVAAGRAGLEHECHPHEVVAGDPPGLDLDEEPVPGLADPAEDRPLRADPVADPPSRRPRRPLGKPNDLAAVPRLGLARQLGRPQLADSLHLSRADEESQIRAAARSVK